jgi:hypothetical protein
VSLTAFETDSETRSILGAMVVVLSLEVDAHLAASADAGPDSSAAAGV